MTLLGSVSKGVHAHDLIRDVMMARAAATSDGMVAQVPVGRMRVHTKAMQCTAAQ